MCAPRSCPVALSKITFAKRDRLAVADERKAANPHIALLLLGGLLGETDRGNLRRAISAAGNKALLHRMWLEALDRLDADDALMLGLVREQRWACDVADGIDAGHVGAAMAVDHDRAAIGLHAELLEPEILDVADDADG